MSNQGNICDAPHETGLCTAHQLPSRDQTGPQVSAKNAHTSSELRKSVALALYQIRTRALRDAPVYLQHVSAAEQKILQLTSTLYTHQQVEQMMDELVGADQRPASESSPLEKQLFPDRRRIDLRNELRVEQRQSIPAILEKYKDVM